MRHNAYERLARRVDRCTQGRGARPTDYRADYQDYRAAPWDDNQWDDNRTMPVVRPTDGPVSEPVCGRCRTWLSCCVCDADVAAMRDALRRIAELHSGCRPDCPERQRLVNVVRAPRHR